MKINESELREHGVAVLINEKVKARVVFNGQIELVKGTLRACTQANYVISDDTGALVSLPRADAILYSDSRVTVVANPSGA